MNISTKIFSIVVVVPIKSILSQNKFYWFPDNLVVKGNICCVWRKKEACNRKKCKKVQCKKILRKKKTACAACLQQCYLGQ